MPGLRVLPDAGQAGHAVPLPVLQLLMKGIRQQKDSVIYIQVGNLQTLKIEY